MTGLVERRYSVYKAPNVGCRPSLPSPALNCLHEIRTGAPSPCDADYREDQYPCHRSEDSSDDTSASTNKKANHSSEKAA